MKSRREIKELGKGAFLARYWACVGVFFLLLVISAGLGSIPLIGFAASLILLGPLTVGANYFYINVFVGNPSVSVSSVFERAFDNFGRKLGGYLWMQLFLILWILLAYTLMFLFFVATYFLDLWGMLLFPVAIAGFVVVTIKVLEYALCTYILSDCPNVRAQDALRLSMRIMKGARWTLFKFYLSYLGWYLLCAVPYFVAMAIYFSEMTAIVSSAASYTDIYTLLTTASWYINFYIIAMTGQVLNVMYVGPWVSTATAGWYLERREQCLRSGVITPAELEGAPLSF